MFTADTNLLLYSVDSDAGQKHEDALQLMALAGQSGAAVLTEQSLIEFLHASVRKRMRPLAQAADSARKWMAVFRVIVPDQTIVERTLALLQRQKLSIWDARLLATCETNTCGVLLSEDMQDGAVYGTVHVLNPFNPRNADTLMELLGK
jgi:predicted nucleic acid-binding protein